MRWRRAVIPPHPEERAAQTSLRSLRKLDCVRASRRMLRDGASRLLSMRLGKNWSILKRRAHVSALLRECNNAKAETMALDCRRRTMCWARTSGSLPSSFFCKPHPLNYPAHLLRCDPSSGRHIATKRLVLRRNALKFLAYLGDSSTAEQRTLTPLI
jgi:hypothetical protein